ncbi:MAG: HAD hydrolase-like protein, partial [Longimicrobiales bacterium]
GARAALERLGAAPAATVLVGDSDEDVLLGAALGARIIRVTRGHAARTSGPAVVVTSLDAALATLERG